MVSIRKHLLANDTLYHIYNRSISKFVIFNNDKEYQRMLDLINLLRFTDFDMKMSRFKELTFKNQDRLIKKLKNESKTYVDIIAYCLMPTHFHLILKQNIDNGIIKYISKISNSYAKYFNTKHKRKGPLWTGRFKNVLIEGNDQLLHLTRYIHLNPTSAKLVNNPDNWHYSSYHEYVSKEEICNYNKYLDIDKNEYIKFIKDRKSYQQQLSEIKFLLIDNYSG